MQRLIRYGSTVALGATLALAGACGRDEAASADSATLVDSAAAATNSAAVPAAPADPSAVPDPGGSGAVSAPNALALIGLSNAGEVQTSQLAQEKATDVGVRDFAKLMISDHQAMQKDADALAAKASITPAPPPQAEQKRAATEQLVQQLTAAPKGAEFDRAYVDGQVQAHQQALTELQQLQLLVENADVKALVEKAIPKVQDHLARAQKLQAGLK